MNEECEYLNKWPTGILSPLVRDGLLIVVAAAVLLLALRGRR